VPDLNKAISNRRKNLKKTYASKEWKKNVKEFIAGKKCEWCGTTEKLLAHHPYLESYKDGNYGNLYFSGCIVLCTRCHFSLHKGLVLCKRCGLHYHSIGAESCRGCFNIAHPEIVEAKKKKVEETKALKKKLRDEEKERVKKWKKEHPKEGVLSKGNWT